MPLRDTVNALVDELIDVGVEPEMAWAVITDAIALGIKTGTYRRDNHHHRKIEVREKLLADPETDAVVTASAALEA
jgi:hypothetical protein